MKYVMVTDFEKHWHELENGFTSYSKNLLTRGLLKEPILNGAETLFIKKNKSSGTIERSWIGSIWDIHVLPGKVFFRVEIKKEVDCPVEYESYPNGWFYA